MFFNDRIFVFLGISQSIGVEVCLMFSLKKKEERERSLQKNRNDYVCFFFFLVIMCEMIYIGSYFRFYGELLRKILSRR